MHGGHVDRWTERATSNLGASHSGQGGDARRIVCTGHAGEGCRTLLVYPQGASNVRCSLCATVTAVPDGGQTSSRTSQLDCAGCRVRLAYESGATSVRCALCATVNGVQNAALAHCQCGGCGLTLAYAGNAQSVRCAACEHVTRVGADARDGANRSAPSPFAGSTGKSSVMVVVENPPTLDAKGVARSNMAVGLVCED